MAAVYYKFSGSNDLFMPNIKMSSPIAIDFMDSIVSKADNLIIYTDISVQTSETIQYFMSFDDLIEFFFFGKGIGSVTINGIILTTCQGDLPGLKKLYTAISAMRGKEINVSMGGALFWGPLTNTVVTIVAEPDTMATFSLNMAITGHTLDTGGS